MTSNIEEIKKYVIEGYRKVLKRDPDPGGFQKYVEDISSGKLSREKFLDTLKNSQEYKNRQKFLEMLGTHDNGEKLNFGCGIDKIPGYKNIDVRQDVKPDIVLNLEDIPYPFKNQSIDKILASDIIEHFSFVNIEKIVREWYRILKIGGKLIIRTPDFDIIISSIKSRNIKRWRDISWQLYGAQDYSYNFHKLIFTKGEIKSFLGNIGFKIENIYNDGPNIICGASKIK